MKKKEQNEVREMTAGNRFWMNLGIEMTKKMLVQLRVAFKTEPDSNKKEEIIQKFCKMEA